ncbi:unnamed protein product [Brugia timori]|uniref:Uncharacterized protein n=1 Tax=Brugia timori TaxID=42155 RepID=A0A3P7THI7_9BILA|nr:unnamed protein product [Brugia timori]
MFKLNSKKYSYLCRLHNVSQNSVKEVSVAASFKKLKK